MKKLIILFLLCSISIVTFGSFNAHTSKIKMQSNFSFNSSFFKPEIEKNSSFKSPLNDNKKRRSPLISIGVFGNASLYSDGFGIMRGGGIDLNIHRDEDNILFFGFNYYYPSTNIYTVKLDHKYNTLTELKYDAEAVSVQSAFEYDLGWKIYYVQDAEETFGMYFIAECSLAFFRKKTNVAIWDTLNFENPYQNRSEKEFGFFAILGTGLHLKTNEFTFFTEFKLLIPANLEGSEGAEITVPAGLNISLGVRFPIIYD